MRWAIVALSAALWMAGCTFVPSQSASPLNSPRATVEWATGSSEVAVITVERSGGFAGIHEVWRFYEDGRVVKTEQRRNITEEAQLPPGAVKDAVARIVEAGFLDLADEYMPANRCCDRFTYRLTIVYEGSVKTVTTMDGAEQPPALARAMEVVNTLIGQATSGQ